MRLIALITGAGTEFTCDRHYRMADREVRAGNTLLDSFVLSQRELVGTNCGWCGPDNINPRVLATMLGGVA